MMRSDRWQRVSPTYHAALARDESLRTEFLRHVVTVAPHRRQGIPLPRVLPVHVGLLASLVFSFVVITTGTGIASPALRVSGALGENEAPARLTRSSVSVMHEWSTARTVFHDALAIGIFDGR
ncbi:MAG: hypothetical protein ABJA98_23770 [Acidobacteriota bacterium]